MISTNYALHSQCEANFVVVSNGSDYQFSNVSTLADGDEITSQLWIFGDNNTTTNENPTHTYNINGIYDVILQISTASGCNDSDTMSVEVCNISLDFNLSTVCDNDEEVALNLEINDESNVLDSVLIYLDDILYSDTAVSIFNGIINYNIKVPGDGNQHFVRVESVPNGFCSETIGFFVQDCNASCFLSQLNIDDGYQQTHNIVLLETEFSPNNREIDLGDMVRFIWLDDNHSSTSVDTLSSDQWDSGVQDSSFILEITPKNPGIKPFYSTSDGGPTGPYSGNIIANCPENRGSLINISFLNNAAPPSGFYIGIDGVILKETIYNYDLIGLTNVEFFLPGDAKTHQLSIIDVEDESCTIKKTVKAINCNGFFDCSLNVNVDILERCNEDSLVLVGIDVSSLSPTNLGVEIILDDTIVVDTIFYTGNQASTSFSIFGDGQIHTITAMDLTDNFCVDQASILVNDCSASCSINELEIGTGSNSTIVLAVTDFAISLQNLSMSSGDDILWQWIQDSLVGVRSIADSGPNSWDSGLLTDGDVFVSPILAAGFHPYYLYNENGDTLFNANVEVIASCDENKIPVFYNFLDVNGSVAGFDIYVDSIRLESGPFNYALDGNNRGVFQLEGDDQEHLIEIRDLSENECFSGAFFVAPTCEAPPCGGLIELEIQDSCFNENIINYLATISHPNPTEQGFLLLLNGELVEGSPFFYGANGETQILGPLLADSLTYNFTYIDLADPGCVDTLTYQSPQCVTDCNIQFISTQLVDSFFLIDNPNTPDSLVGCQDSFINVAVVFNEKYSDSDSFRIVVDNVLDETIYGYKLGDGLNTIFVSVRGDDAIHTIQFFDHLDSTCTFTAEVFTPACFSPCIIEIDNIVLDNCVNEVASYTINLESTTNKYDYSGLYDGEPIDIAGDSLIANFTSSADGLEHYMLIFDNEVPLCKDSIFFTAGYCLDCPIDIQLVQKDSCEIGDSIGYEFIFNSEIDSLDILVETGDSSYIINPSSVDFSNEIRLRGDSAFYQYIFTSTADQFCIDTVEIQTIDCTPVICEPNFSFTIDGLTITFLDNSVTSESIIDQSWSINDIVNIGNVSTFNYTVDSIGLYNICHTITTDSCSSTICEEVLVGDPCTQITPLFTFEKLGDGYQFTNMSTGNIDSYLYRFGDGIISNNPDPFHVFPDTGTYEICLTITQDQFSCEEEYCILIDVTLNSNKNIILNNNNIVVYPNPVSHEIKGIKFIYETNHLLSKNDIAIIDIEGRKVSNFSLENKRDNLYGVSFEKEILPGIYYMIIRAKNSGMDSVKFVVY